MISSRRQILDELWKPFDSMRGLDALYSMNCILGILLVKKESEDPYNEIINWADIEASSFDIGEKLNQAFYRYEEKHMRHKYISGQFKELDFNSDLIGTRDIRDNIWKEIISKLSKINLTSLDKSNPGALCELVLEINEHFSTLDRGIFGQPLSVIRILSEILSTKKGSNIYDPRCWNGTTLIGSTCLMRKENSSNEIHLFGQTPSQQNLLTLHLNLLLTDNTKAEIKWGDLIRDPYFREGERLKTFPKILTMIPYGMKNWGEEFAQRDPYSRFRYGVPPRTQGEYGYLQHCIASLSEDGILAVVIPPSMLFRERTEGEIRRRIISDDIIEAVISLPPKIYPYTSIQFAILVINRKKPEVRKEKILFINAMNNYLPGRSQNTLSDDDVNNILTVFKEFKSVEGYSRVCSLDEIAKNNFLLDVSQYITQKKEIINLLDLDKAMNDLDSIHSEKNTAYKEMKANLRKVLELQEMS